MPDRTRLEVINAINERGVIARLKAGEPEETRAAVTDLADGGARVIEIVLSERRDERFLVPLIEQLRDHDPAVILGTGPQNNPEGCSRMMYLGLDFVTGSFLDLDAAQRSNSHKILYIPICSDLEELSLAEEEGLELIRFKASKPDDLAEVLGERPRSSLSPAGSLKAGEMEPWFKAGAAFVSLDFDPAAEDLAKSAADLIWAAAQARGLPLFSGVEHLGTYPEAGQEAREIADWYRDNLGFNVLDGETFFFVSSAGPGRIEILKQSEPVRAHVAVKVRHLGEAIKTLEAKGFSFEPIKDFGRVKAVFLKDRDPAGNKVHLLYQALA